MRLAGCFSVAVLVVLVVVAVSYEADAAAFEPVGAMQNGHGLTFSDLTGIADEFKDRIKEEVID